MATPHPPTGVRRALRQWCLDNIGPRWSAVGPERETGLWTVFWAGPEAPDKYRWHFKHEKDAMWFRLRWE